MAGDHLRVCRGCGEKFRCRCSLGRRHLGSCPRFPDCRNVTIRDLAERRAA